MVPRAASEMASQITMTALFYELLKPVSKRVSLLSAALATSVAVSKLSAAAIALDFLGFSTLLNGYLIVRSSFLPQSLGVVTALGGLRWLAFLSPSLGYRLFPYIAAVGFLGAVSTILWLLVLGVNEQLRKEQANAEAASFWR